LNYIPFPLYMLQNSYILFRRQKTKNITFNATKRYISQNKILMKKILVFFLLLCLTMTDCQHTNKTRKCNGKKGIKTPMGLM